MKKLILLIALLFLLPVSKALPNNYKYSKVYFGVYLGISNALSDFYNPYDKNYTDLSLGSSMSLNFGYSFNYYINLELTLAYSMLVRGDFLNSEIGNLNDVDIFGLELKFRILKFRYTPYFSIGINVSSISFNDFGFDGNNYTIGIGWLHKLSESVFLDFHMRYKYAILHSYTTHFDTDPEGGTEYLILNNNVHYSKLNFTTGIEFHF
ncbi:MAG: hypothetical protein KAR07_10780 [Spirochaetes bacterium]|nr:hypothetical protein [Spirochaetota bacterium]